MGCDLCVTDLQDVRSAEQEDKERREREESLDGAACGSRSGIA